MSNQYLFIFNYCSLNAEISTAYHQYPPLVKEISLLPKHGTSYAAAELDESTQSSHLSP